MNNIETTQIKLLTLNAELSTVRTSAAANDEQYAENPLAYIIDNIADPVLAAVITRYANAVLSEVTNTKDQWEIASTTLPEKILESVAIEDSQLIVNNYSQDFIGFYLDTYS